MFKTLIIIYQFILQDFNMDIFLQDANNGTDNLFHYCQTLLTIQQIDSLDYSYCLDCENKDGSATEGIIIQDFYRDPHDNHLKMKSEDEEGNKREQQAQIKMQSSFDTKLVVQTQIIKSQPQKLFTNDNQEQSQLSYNYSITKQQNCKYSKNKKIKSHYRQAYPTKNFLPTFRPFFLNYLQQYFSYQNFNKIEIIQRIKNKKCINMKDYQDLLNQPQFRVHLIAFFACGQIFRDLMLCRIEMKFKIQYFKRINVFQKAFISKHFPKIN